jgi:hypothetical protein
VSKVPEGVEDRHGLYVVARRVLLDALVALKDHADAVKVVGAQAVYLRSAEVELSVASYTSDADLGLDPARLADEPLIEAAMTRAGFVRGDVNHAGSWLRSERVGDVVADIAVDLLVPESLSEGGRRSVRIPPHHKMSARRVPGLEAAVVDNDDMPVASLEPHADDRVLTARVAGPAALLIAKTYKIHERTNEPRRDRLTDKDAGDVVRLMMTSYRPSDVAARFRALLADERTRATATTGLHYLEDLFGGRATTGVEMAVSALAGGMDEQAIRTLPPAYLTALLNEL